MYCTFKDVRLLIKEDCLYHLIGDPYELQDFERDAKLKPLIETAILDAANEINGYLSVRYNVPINNPPGILNKLSKDIALYNLFCRVDEDTAKPYYERYRAAIGFLKDISKGTADLGISSTPQGAPKQGKFQVSSSPKVFGRNNLKGM